MSYTLSLLNQAAAYFVPGYDGQEKASPISKRQEEARLSTANRLAAAVKKGEMEPRFEKVAKKMKQNAKKKLREVKEQPYQKTQKILNDMNKLAMPLDVIIPGSGATVSVICQIGSVGNFLQSSEIFSVKGFCKKTLGIAIPIISNLASSVWSAWLEPLATPTVIGSAVAAIGGSALVLDAADYLRA